MTKKRQDKEILMKEGAEFIAIVTKGLLGKSVFGKIVFPMFLVLSICQFLFIMIFRKPALIVGTGGYASFVPLFCGILLGLPTVISEQDSYPGFTTRLLSRYVTEVHIAHKKALSYLKSKSLYVSGNPLRDSVFTGTRSEAMDYFGLSRSKKTILILGGSHGARSINSVFIEVLKAYSFTGKQFIFQTGTTDYEWVDKALGGVKSDVVIKPFIEKMNLAYSASDLVFSRAGALATAEITAKGIPSVLIPYPFATGGHQEENARRLEKRGASVVLLDMALSCDRIFDLISSLFSDRERLQKMHMAAIASCKQDAAKKIAYHIVRLLRSGGRDVQEC